MAEVAGTVAGAFEAQVREHEESWLSPLAVRSYDTRGRLRDEDDCRLRTPFQRDRDRILHSKPFRRLKGKTQVFIDPAGDHYRTRMTHTLETTGIARVVSRALAPTTRAPRGGRPRARTWLPRRSATPARPRSTSSSMKASGTTS